MRSVIPHFSGFLPMVAKYEFSGYAKKIQKAHPIRNFILNSFDLCDQFHIPNGLTDPLLLCVKVKRRCLNLYLK